MKKIIKNIKSYFSVNSEIETHPEFYTYLAANIILTIFFLNIFFWLLWALLVFKGGIFPKIPAILQVVFTKKTLADFGYEGYPYELGVFDGWITNTIALILLFAFIVMCWWLLYRKEQR